MIKRLSLVIGSLCLILGFQNCSQQNNLSEEGSLGAASGALASPADASKITYVEIMESPLVPTVSNKVGSVSAESRLLISPKTGEIHAVDSLNKVLDTKCLSAADLATLNQILNSASICKMPVTKADMCATRYIPAYAALVLGQERINLGEQRDSCGYGRQEICGSLGEVFRDFVSHVRENIDNMKCQ